MATLSSSWKPAAFAAKRPQAQGDVGAPSSISRPSSPSPQAGESATTIAWQNALHSYRKSLSDKDFKRIMIPAGPEDIAKEVEKWQTRQSASRYARVATAVRAGVGRMQRFSASIDMLAQGSPSPGCLLWGSIRFALTIVQDAAEEYGKLCQALSRMVDCLPQIELYTETFLDSEIVRACVSSFYISTLRFWGRACKFYRRHRLLNLIRVIWNDFDAEFSELEIKMIGNRDRVEKAALAEHIGQSMVARVHQQSVNQKLLEVQNSARRKEITAWLAPTAYDVDYYQNDLANARALRHPKTCQWIFEKREIGHLFADTPNGPETRAYEESLLWIYAKPGAGKTVLSSRLVDHYIIEDDRFQNEHVFYFFCKSTDADKNNATAVIRSLLYQLYKSTKEPETQMRLTADIEQALDKSGKRQSVDFAPLWANFADNVKCVSPALIVLDALDECLDPERLVQGLKSISLSGLIKVIMTSRKEAHLFTQLRSDLSLEITPEDINADIGAYVEAKVLGSPRLSHPLVRNLVIARLSTGHSGMFLWVYLMLKELKSCFSMIQVQGVLANPPQGLDGIYESILQRLQENLPTASVDLCYKVLTWVVSAIRPLKIDELKHALSLHHGVEGDTLLFEYAEKDIELVCGSLITVRQETLQVVHLTVKEFLTSTHGPKCSTYSSLLIDPAKASLDLTLACLKCINVSCNKSFVSLDPGIARLDITLDVEAVIQRQRQAPLAEYASLTWMMHLIECKENQMIVVSKAFQETFDSPSTFYWVEACMAFQPDSVLHLLLGLEEVVDYVSGLGSDHWREGEASCDFFADWCYALRDVFKEFGPIISHRPWEIHFLDLQSSLSKIKQLYRNSCDTSRRDATLRITDYKSPRACRPEAHAHTRLQHDLQGGYSHLFFFIHDERRRLYFWGESHIDLSHMRLFVQNATTGQRLPPAVKLDGEAGLKGHLSSYGLSPSGEYIVVVYWAIAKNSEVDDGFSLTVIWQINEEMRFNKRMRSEPWARVLSSHQCEIGVFSTTAASVVFLDGGYCLTPCGEIHLASGSRRPLLDRLSNLSVSDESIALGSFYSQNGKYLFISEMMHGASGKCRASMVAPFTETPLRLCSWKDSNRRLADVSPSGRFLVLSNADDSLPMGRGEEFLYLYDIDTNKTVQLPFAERLDYLEAKYHFMKDEMELIVFIPCLIHEILTMNVLVWSDLQSDPWLRTCGQLKQDGGIEDGITPKQIHINGNGSYALMVSGNRVIQRVDFHTQVTFPDAPDVNGDYPCTLSQVSKDGTYWALLRYGQDKAQLQMTDVSSANGSIKRLDLELSPCAEPGSRAVSFSPDLCLLVVDAEVFSINEGDHGLTSASFTIQYLPELLVRYQTRLNPRHWCQLRCLISSCNSYVIFISEGAPLEREVAPSTVYAFRIDLVSRSSSRLDLHLPKDLIFISADFHPSQRLMLLSYASSSKSGAQLWEEVPLLQICIIGLEGLDTKPIVLPNGGSFLKRLKEHWTTHTRMLEAMFSDSGTSVLLDYSDWGDLPPCVIHQLDADPVSTRYFRLELCYLSTYLTSSGKHLIEAKKVDDTSYRLVSRKLTKIDLSEENSDVTRQDLDDSAVYLDNFICFPSSLADSDKFLLLGQDDDEVMRLLIAPREGRCLEIRPLSLSFNEAKRRLEAEWAKRQALRDKEMVETGQAEDSIGGEREER